jgi:hypothetical protein
MEERDEKRGGAGCAIGCVALLFLLPVLYVLSIGPAALIVIGKPFGARSLDRVYYPLGVLARNCERAEKALTWYMELWTE